MSKTLRFFIAGIIQGSLHGDATHPQDYRVQISEMLRTAFADAEIFDPVEEYPDSITYSDGKAAAAFFDLMKRAGDKQDVLVAFVPSASMGTAIELWQAYNAGSFVVTVSPLTTNWVVRYLSDILLPDITALQKYIASGGLAADLAAKRQKQ